MREHGVVRCEANFDESAETDAAAERLADAEAQADLMRNLYWDGEFPIDPNKMAVKMGAAVYFARLPEGETVVIAKKADDRMPEIFVDERAQTQRKRFAIAHALGHYVEQTAGPTWPTEEFLLSDGALAGETLLLAKRDEEAVSTQELSERLADDFALCLLMPEEEIRRFEDAKLTVRDAAAYFNVSELAVKNRLDQLGIRL